MTPETVTMIKATLEMFIFLAVELTILFLAISYIVGVLQEYIPPEKIESILSSKNGRGYFVAALLGAITPFCSCSTIPFLKGLLRAKAGFGPMMVFLFSSPLLNPIVISLFVITFGVKVAVLYFSIAMGVSVIAGYVLEKLKFDKYIKPFNTDTNNTCSASSCETTKESTSCCDTSPSEEAETSCCDTSPEPAPKTISKWRRIWDVAWTDFKVALPYLLVGVTIGSIIHGFVPTEFITKYAGDDNPLAIPFAAVIGIPLYLRAITLIPLSEALVLKGMGIGAVMAFIIGSAGASLPEVILLKSMFKNQLIIAFLGVVLGMAIFMGLLFTYVV
ncbi:MAG: permease [Cocleimonas sp.]|nr:permease [Cocleimonas sp.]